MKNVQRSLKKILTNGQNDNRRARILTSSLIKYLLDYFVRFNRFNSYRDKIKIKPGGIPGYYNIKGEN